MVKIKQGECTICKEFKAVDEDWMCGSCAAKAFVKGDSESVAEVPCSVGLEGQTIKDLKRHQELCSKLSKMKYAILEAVEYLDSNKLNQIGAESIIHKNLRDAVAD